MAADINKIKNLPSFSYEKTDMLIGFSVSLWTGNDVIKNYSIFKQFEKTLGV